jgi:hypothetical protein
VCCTCCWCISFVWVLQYSFSIFDAVIMGNGASISPRSVAGLDGSAAAHLYATKAVESGMHDVIELYAQKHQQQSDNGVMKRLQLSQPVLNYSSTASSSTATTSASITPVSADAPLQTTAQQQQQPSQYATATFVPVPTMKLKLGLTLDLASPDKAATKTNASIANAKAKGESMNDFSRFLNKGDANNASTSSNNGASTSSRGNNQQPANNTEGLSILGNGRLISSNNLNSLSTLKSIKSLRSFALQHRSRHENSYISQETIMSASRGLNKKTVEGGRRSFQNVLDAGGLGGTGGGNAAGIAGGSLLSVNTNKHAYINADSVGGGNGDSSSFNLDLDLTLDRNIIKDANREGGGSVKKPAALKLGGNVNSNKQSGKPHHHHHQQLHNNSSSTDVDDADWIQVSDDEDSTHHGHGGHIGHAQRTHSNGSPNDSMHEGYSKRPQAALHAQNHNCQAADESIVFTQSGTIFVEGFASKAMGIRVDGMFDALNASPGTPAPIGSRLNIKDRVVVLCRLGSGASSVVYKALDLRDMRLVALKMVAVNERSKRRQVGRELSALFQFLKQKPIGKNNDIILMFACDLIDLYFVEMLSS